MHPKEKKIIHHEIPGKQWEINQPDMFYLYNKHSFYIRDYYSKLLVINKTKIILPESLILAGKVILSEYGLLKKTILEAGSHFLREIQKRCSEQAVSSSYHVPKQWTSGNMHQTLQVNTQETFQY